MLLFIGFGLAVLYLLYGTLNRSYAEDCVLKGIPAEECNLVLKVRSDLALTNSFWLFMVCVCFFVSNVSRSLRWQQLLQSLGYTTRWLNSFHCVMLAYFANLGFPRLGEVVRAGSMAKYERIPFEKVVGTVALDRIIDLVCFGVLFLITLIFRGDLLLGYFGKQVQLSGGSPVLWVLLIGVMAGMYLLWRLSARWQSLQLIVKLRLMAKGFADGLRSLRQVKNLTLLIGHSMNIWLMYFLMTYLNFKAFPPTAHLNAADGLMICVFGSLGMLVPTPGGMGSYHAAAIAGLTLLSIHQNDAFSFSMIIFFTVNIFGNILFGIIALLMLPSYNRRYTPVREK